MIKVALFLAFIVVLSVSQCASLRKQGLMRETWGYMVVMVLVSILGGVEILGFKISNPKTPVELVFESLGRMILQQ